jgi:uncharacterized protein (DUF302 family)
MTEAETPVRLALSEQRFWVLTEIDVAANLGVDRPALMIPGACNPGFADRSLEVDAPVARVLPC